MFKRLILVIMLCALSVCSASAHPGRTDSEGGHWDSSAGEYHYHHGYPAHYHTNGYCPYYYDDKTGWNSGNSSSNSNQSSSSTYRPVIPAPKEEINTAVSQPQNDKNLSEKSEFNDLKSEPSKGEPSFLDCLINLLLNLFSMITEPLLVVIGLFFQVIDPDLHFTTFAILAFFYGPPLVGLTYGLMYILRNALISLKDQVFAFFKFPSSKDRENYLQAQKKDRDRNEYVSMYGGKSFSELTGAPPDIEIGLDDLPKECGADGWGQRFTFYISSKGKSYHCVSGCSGAGTPIHAWNLSATNRKPCKRCNPKLPDLEWYPECKRIRDIKRIYDID